MSVQNIVFKGACDDVNLIDVTLTNEEDVKLSGPFDYEQESTEVEEDGQHYYDPPDREVELAKDDGLEQVSENTLEEELHHDLGIETGLDSSLSQPSQLSRSPLPRCLL